MTPADVVFVIEEKAHARFRREGSDLLYTHRLPLVEALCGPSFSVTTLDGRTLPVTVQSSVGPSSVKVRSSMHFLQAFHELCKAFHVLLTSIPCTVYKHSAYFLQAFHVLLTSVPCTSYTRSMHFLHAFHVLPTRVPCTSYARSMYFAQYSMYFVQETPSSSRGVNEHLLANPMRLPVTSEGSRLCSVGGGDSPALRENHVGNAWVQRRSFWL